MTTADQLRLLALCALRDNSGGLDWSLIAREALRQDGLESLLSGQIIERSPAATRSLPLLRRLLPDLATAEERVRHELELADSVSARLVTVRDAAYPPNLKLISNLPPFLVVIGDQLRDIDLRSVAVVGTRQPSHDGLERARHIAKSLVAAGVTVVSGLASGIDTAAHEAALAAGGRTIAVIGTGVTRTYPQHNTELARQIAAHGAVVSQFWPSTAPAKWTFPRRNVVMSGIAQGTIVVEATSTSGAKMQARLALEHGKHVFLVEPLVTEQPWARRYIAQRGAITVADVEDILRYLASPERIRTMTEQRQLTLDLV